MNRYELEVTGNEQPCCSTKKLRLKFGENGFCLYNAKGELVIDASLLLETGQFTAVRKSWSGQYDTGVKQLADETDNIGQLLRWRFELCD